MQNDEALTDQGLARALALAKAGGLAYCYARYRGNYLRPVFTVKFFFSPSTLLVTFTKAANMRGELRGVDFTHPCNPSPTPLQEITTAWKEGRVVL